MIYAIYKYGLRMEAIGFLDMHMFWHLQFSVSGFAIFGDSLYLSTITGYTLICLTMSHSLYHV